MSDVEDRRLENKGPPTQIMDSYRSKSEIFKKRLAYFGGFIFTFTVVVPMVGQLILLGMDREPFGLYYWTFAGIFGFVGVCMMWPELGIGFFTLVTRFFAKVWPTKKLEDAIEKLPDRRAANREE